MDKTKLTKLEELLYAAVQTEGADMGILRAYKSEDDELPVIIHHGFSMDYVQHFKTVKPFDKSSCGRAFGIGSTILINDTEQDLSFKGENKQARSLNSQFRAVISVPIITARGKKLGVLSLHFKNPKWEWHFEANNKIITEIIEILN